MIDLEFGWHMAKLAAQVRDGQHQSGICADYRPVPWGQRLVAANTREALTVLWHSTTDEALHAAIREKASTLHV